MKKIYEKIDSRTYYIEVLRRIKCDLEIPMRYYHETGHGAWASIRMLMPVIESIQTNNKSVYMILEELGFHHPRSVWKMYRHGLLHNDTEPQSLQYQSKSIGWGINWGQGEVEMIFGDNISINPWLLYTGLKGYIKNQIKTLTTENSTVCRLLIFEDNNKEDEKIIDEILSI